MRLGDLDLLRNRFIGYKQECLNDDDYASANVFSDVIAEIEDADTIDPVKHGRWVYEPGNVPKCSECGEYSDDAMNGAQICPWCGAHNE